MPHHEISPARSPGHEKPRPGQVPINTDEQPAGPESGPLQSVDEQRKAERELVPPEQPEDNDV